MKTLSNAIKEWMAQYKFNSVKPTTYDRLETSLNTLMNYPIAFMDILAITTKDLQTFINEMVDDGYALTTIKKQYHLVTAYLKFANTEGIIPRPIYNNVRLPTRQAVKKKQREILGYSVRDQAALNHVL